MRKLSTSLITGLVLPLAFLFGACSEDDPMTPGSEVVVSTMSLAFGDVDVTFGGSASQSVSVTNAGGQTLNIMGYTVSGPFEITSGGALGALAPGATAMTSISFNPTTPGAGAGSLDISTDDPEMPMVSVALTGNGGQFQYTQVDREGIPTINTVFNHPPAFSKTDFNTAGPDADLATYRGQFETVLGAVANEDPPGTTSLLLPDALPVDLGEATTSFATLTGRALADDAVDVALTVVVGVAELESDNVDMNDVAFLSAFPYLAPPN